MDSLSATNNTNSLIAGRDIKNNKIVINVLAQSRDYQKLTEDRQKLVEDINTYQEILSLLPEDAEQKKMPYLLKLKDANEKIELLNKEMDSFKNNVIKLAKHFSEIEIDSEADRKAKQFFEEGKIIEAQNALNEKELENVYQKLLASNEEREKEIEENKKKISHIANQYLLKANLALLNYADSERLVTAEKFFNESLKKAKFLENLDAYAEFLQDQFRYEEEINAYDEILNLKNKVNEPERVRILHNMVFCYGKLEKFDKVNECIYQIIDAIKFDNLKDTFLSVLLLIGSLETAQLNSLKKKEEIEISIIEQSLLLRSVISKIYSRQFLPLEVKALHSFSALLIEKGMIADGIKYFEQSIKKVKLYLSDNPEYPTAFHPKDVVLGIVTSLEKLSQIASFEKERINFYVNELIEILQRYHELIEKSIDRSSHEKEVFLSISMSYFHLANIAPDKEFELLSKAFSFNTKVELTKTITQYLFGIFRKLIPFGEDNVKFFYDASVAAIRLFPYMNIDSAAPGMLEMKEAILQFIKDYETEQQETNADNTMNIN